MNEKNLEIISNAENMSFSIGDFIQDDKERIGEIIGIDEINGEKLLKAKFSEHTGYFPLSRIGKDLIIVKREEISIPSEKTIEDFLREKEFERRHKISQETLQRYIKSYKFKIEELGLIFDEKIEKELREIIEEALEKNYVFRGDGRHPYAKSLHDISERIEKGIFEVGLNSEEGKYDGYVYTTADINRALGYPYEGDMPSEWDKQKFIYFIDPKIIYQNIIDLKDLENNQIRTLDIPPKFIKYAVQVDDQTNRVIEVFRNIKNK